MSTPAQVGDGAFAVVRSGSRGEPKWLAQNERPTHVGDLPFPDLPVELRLLLVHDGTLTTALEAHQLAPIVADVQAQREMPLRPDYARWLRADPGIPALHRRTVLRLAESSGFLVQADVVLLLHRLPAEFPTVLAGAAKGLGAALAQLRVETRRELLWFGRTRLTGLAAADVAVAGHDAVSRCYRLMVGSTPVGCIQEAFPDRLGWGAESISSVA